MSELRRDPITGRYVIVAPERLLTRAAFNRAVPSGALDGDMCPFCEGQEHVAGREILAWRPTGSARDGMGWQLRVVANREPALRVEAHLGEPAPGLLHWFGGLGAHEVIIESARHRATIATMTGDQVERVLWAWRERIRDLRRDVRLESFLIVKNVGAAAGATLDHPHSQLLALPLVPQHLEDELAGARAYHERTAGCVWCELAADEIAAYSRLVGSDDETVAFTPFASRVPFELCVMPRGHEAAFEEATDAVLMAVAERLRDTMRRLDEVLVTPPYTLLLHTAPVEVSRRVVVDGAPADSATPGSKAAFHWHLEVIPRLLPVAGLAWDGGIHINPVTPEEAAEALRAVIP